MTEDEIQTLTQKVKNGMASDEERASLIKALTGGRDSLSIRPPIFKIKLKSPLAIIMVLVPFLVCLVGFGYFVSRYGFIVSHEGCGRPTCVLFLQPNQGSPGSSVTIHGDGYSKQNNVVNFAGDTSSSVSSLSSPDTFTLVISVPQLPSGTYQVSVVTGAPGNTESNKMSFTIQ
jgi:hypothetical protein